MALGGVPSFVVPVALAAVREITEPLLVLNPDPTRRIGCENVPGPGM